MNECTICGCKSYEPTVLQYSGHSVEQLCCSCKQALTSFLKALQTTALLARRDELIETRKAVLGR
jgi:hypothetical protein